MLLATTTPGPGAPPDEAPRGDDVLPAWLAAQYEALGGPVRGSAGVVFRARERASGQAVALKIAGSATMRAELAREARLAPTVRHPHVLDVRAVHGPGGALALVSPWAAGGTLRAALSAAHAAAGPDARAPLGYARTAAVLRDVAAALAHVHRTGVAHADVKPENVFLEAEGGRALLGDFGIARRAGPGGADVPNELAAGTPAYMAPEQAAGAPLDAHTDVYALGLVGWELLAGRRPWDGRALADVLHAQRYESLPALAELCPDVPAYLLAAVEGALVKDPAARWADGGEMLARLSPTPAPLPVALGPAVSSDVGTLSGATVRFTPARSGAAGPRGGGRAWTRPGRLAIGVVAAVALAAAVGRASSRPDVGAPRVVAPHVAASVAAPEPVSRSEGGEVTSSTPTGHTGGADAVCGTPTETAQRACARAAAAPAERRAAAAVESLAVAIRSAAEPGWEPAALAQLRAEQARWAADAARECPAPADGSAAGWGAARGACLAERAARRTAGLQARRARFSPPAGSPDQDR